MIRKNFLFLLGALMLSIAYALPSEVFIKDQMKRGNFVVAEEQLKQLVAAYPTNAKYDYWLAQAEERNKEYPQALVHLRRAIQLDPGLTFGKPQAVRSMEGRLVAINSVNAPAPKIKVTTTTTYGPSTAVSPTRVAYTEPPKPSTPWPWGKIFFILGLIAATAAAIWGYLQWRAKAVARNKFVTGKADLLGEVLRIRKKIESAIELNSLSTRTYDAVINGRLRSLLSSDVLPLLTHIQGLDFVDQGQSRTDLENAQRKLNGVHAAFTLASRPEDDVEKASVKREEYQTKAADKAFEDVFGSNPISSEPEKRPRNESSGTTTGRSYSRRSAPYSPPVQRLPTTPAPEVHHHHHTTVSSQPSRSLGEDLLTLAVVDSLLHSHHNERPVVNNHYNEAPSTTVTREVEVDAPELDVDYTPAEVDVDEPRSYSRTPEPDLADSYSSSSSSSDSSSSLDFGSDSSPSLDLD